MSEFQEKLKEAIGVATEALKNEPETLVETLPDIMYITDVSEEMEADKGERFYGAAPDRDDLVGGDGEEVVGIYKLIAVQIVERVDKVRTLGTEFAPPGAKELDIDLGKGGVSVAGEPAEIEGVGFASMFVGDDD